MKRNILSSLVLAFIAISLYSQDPNILWQRTIGGSADETFYTIQQIPDGGYYNWRWFRVRYFWRQN